MLLYVMFTLSFPIFLSEQRCYSRLSGGLGTTNAPLLIRGSRSRDLQHTCNLAGQQQNKNTLRESVTRRLLATSDLQFSARYLDSAFAFRRLRESSATEMKYSRQATGKQELGLVCGAWVPRAGSVRDSPSAFVLLGRYDVNSERAIDVREYNFDSDTLSDTIHAIETEDGRPWQFAVHPSGDGFLCSFSNSCKFYEINPKGPWKLKASERRLPLLQGKQIQNCICFSSDGSFLATGGKDGHLRLYTWPACHLVLDERHARPIQDIDISMDSAYVASIAEDGACRVWNITKGECIAQLRREKLDEKFGCCRFSRDGTQAFLFASFTKKGSFLGGYIGVWNMVGWSMIGSKKFDCNPISSLAVTRDGKSLCSGSTGGDMAVISVRKMEVTQVVRTVRFYPITGLEFSKHGRSLLILGADTNARVAQLEMSERKDSQLYLVLLGMIALSGLLFFAIFESSLSDDFWKFPMGRAQPALPSPETTWGYPSY